MFSCFVCILTTKKNRWFHGIIQGIWLWDLLSLKNAVHLTRGSRSGDQGSCE